MKKHHLCLLIACCAAIQIHSAFAFEIHGVLAGTTNSVERLDWKDSSGKIIDNNGGESGILAITPDGTFSVGWAEQGSGVNAAFLWKVGDEAVLKLKPNGLQFSSSAFAVSDDAGVIVGTEEQTSWRWTKAGGMVDLGKLPGSDATVYDSAAYGVTPDGAIVIGETYTTSSQFYPKHAYKWTAASGMVALPEDGSGSGARAISRDGSTIVGYGNGGACKWTSSGIELLGQIPGFTRSYANAVSADGSVIVGWAEEYLGMDHVGNNYYKTVPFIWTKDAGIKQLGYPATTTGGTSRATGISADGKIVIGNYISGSSGIPFLWTEETGMVSVQELLQNAYGLDAGEWRLTDVNAISPDGAIIAGVGYGPKGPQGWIAKGITTISGKRIDVPPDTPPDPAPVALVPSVSVSKKKITTAKAALKISGAAKGVVSAIRYRVGTSGAYKKANGTSRWNFTAKLKPGKNLITIVATGPGGSKTIKVTVIRK